MRRVAFLYLLICMVSSAESWSWQDAKVVKIGHSVDKAEEHEYRGTASAGIESSGVATRTTNVWTYSLKTEDKLYIVKVEKKPIADLREGDRVRATLRHGALYVLTTDAKKHRLELLKSE
jgi:hypothetical protein